MNVKNILTIKGKDVITAQPTQTIQEAIDLLVGHNIGALVVVDQSEQVIGILSERDIIRQLAKEADVLKLPISQVMTTNVITGLPQDDLHAVSNTMTENRVRHLPILVDNKLIGIVSIGDVVKSQRDLFQGEVDTLQTQLMSAQE